MGNSNSTPSNKENQLKAKLLENYTILQGTKDLRYGEVMLLIDPKSGEKLCLRELLSKSSEDFIKEDTFLKKRSKIKHPNLVKLVAYDHTDSEKLCAIMCKFFLLLEYLDSDLDQELASMAKLQQSYSEEQLNYLLESIVAAFNRLQLAGIVHGDIKPERILMSQAKQYKIADNNLMGQTIPSYYQLMSGFKDVRCYLSPALLASMKKGELHPIHNPFKSDVFSLGMIILYAGLMKDTFDLYDFEKYEIKLNELKNRIDQFKAKYSTKISSIIEEMLIINEETRPDFIKLMDKFKNKQIFQGSKDNKDNNLIRTITFEAEPVLSDANNTIGETNNLPNDLNSNKKAQEAISRRIMHEKKSSLYANRKPSPSPVQRKRSTSTSSKKPQITDSSKQPKPQIQETKQISQPLQDNPKANISNYIPDEASPTTIKFNDTNNINTPTYMHYTNGFQPNSTPYYSIQAAESNPQTIIPTTTPFIPYTQETGSKNYSASGYKSNTQLPSQFIDVINMTNTDIATSNTPHFQGKNTQSTIDINFTTKMQPPMPLNKLTKPEPIITTIIQNSNSYNETIIQLDESRTLDAINPLEMKKSSPSRSSSSILPKDPLDKKSEFDSNYAKFLNPKEPSSYPGQYATTSSSSSTVAAVATTTTTTTTTTQFTPSNYDNLINKTSYVNPAISTKYPYTPSYYGINTTTTTTTGLNNYPTQSNDVNLSDGSSIYIYTAPHKLNSNLPITLDPSSSITTTTLPNPLSTLNFTNNPLNEAPKISHDSKQTLENAKKSIEIGSNHPPHIFHHGNEETINSIKHGNEETINLTKATSKPNDDSSFPINQNNKPNTNTNTQGSNYSSSTFQEKKENLINRNTTTSGGDNINDKNIGIFSSNTPHHVALIASINNNNEFMSNQRYNQNINEVMRSKDEQFIKEIALMNEMNDQEKKGNKEINKNYFDKGLNIQDRNTDNQNSKENSVFDQINSALRKDQLISKNDLLSRDPSSNPITFNISNPQNNDNYTSKDSNSSFEISKNSSPLRNDQNLNSSDHYTKLRETYPDGSTYEGDSLNGQRHGFGIFTYADGGLYEGEWKYGTMDGQGTLYYADGKIAYRGGWKEDKFHGKGAVYNEIPDDNATGDEFDYRNFDTLGEYWAKYEGDFVMDNKEGYGILQVANGERYEGEFKNDMVHGKGTYYFNSGDKLTGYWDQNLLMRLL